MRQSPPPALSTPLHHHYPRPRAHFCPRNPLLHTAPSFPQYCIAQHSTPRFPTFLACRHIPRPCTSVPALLALPLLPPTVPFPDTPASPIWLAATSPA